VEQALRRPLLPQQLRRHHRLGRILRLLAPAILRLQLSSPTKRSASLSHPTLFFYFLASLSPALRHVLRQSDAPALTALPLLGVQVSSIRERFRQTKELLESGRASKSPADAAPHTPQQQNRTMPLGMTPGGTAWPQAVA